ncbi:hypothetical protein C0993_000339, partial [Termitomyces sp. T159_Od127]
THGKNTTSSPIEQSRESVTQTELTFRESGETSTPSNIPTPITPSGSERAIVQQLEECVELFRQGKRTKPIAITTIVNVANSSSTPADARQDTINSYLALLDDIKKKAKSLQKRARRGEATQDIARTSQNAEDGTRSGNPRLGGGSTRGEPSDGPRPEQQRVQGQRSSQRSPSPRTVDKLTDEYIQSVHREVTGDESSSDSELSTEGSSESSNEDERPNPKKRKLDIKKMPWYAQEKLARETQNPRYAANRKLLQRYMRNPSEVKRQILTSYTAPTDFPNSEWDKLLRGEPA